MNKIVITVLSVFALTTAQADFFSGTHNWNDGSSNHPFKASIKSAETGYKANLAANMAWRDTGKMIKKAKKLNAEGKTKAAVKLADKAYAQTVNAAAQTALVSKAGPRF
jgi:hypothetical protein